VHLLAAPNAANLHCLISALGAKSLPFFHFHVLVAGVEMAQVLVHVRSSPTWSPSQQSVWRRRCAGARGCRCAP
jgi:hypothetical protein